MTLKHFDTMLVFMLLVILFAIGMNVYAYHEAWVALENSDNLRNELVMK